MELGKKQTLYVVKKVEFGVYLGDSPEAGAESRVLLPAKQVPEGAEDVYKRQCKGRRDL